MIPQFVSRLVGNGIANLRRRASGAGFMVFGLLLLVLAATFVFFGIYLWLSTRINPWLAALAVAGIVVLMSLIFLVAGRAKIRRQSTSTMLHDGEIQSLIAQLLPEGPSGRKKSALSLIVAAAVLGLIIGRRSSQ